MSSDPTSDILSSSTSNTQENEVLSMFFDENFVPHDYLDALFSTSLNSSKQQQQQQSSSNTMKNKSIEFASSRSLNSLQKKCTNLLTHLDFFTNELTKQFENKLQDLQNSSSIISYTSTTAAAASNSNNNSTSTPSSPTMTTSSNNHTTGMGMGMGMGETIGITRLEYYVENLSSSINSLNRDLSEVNSKLTSIEQQQQQQQQNSNNESIQTFKDLNMIKFKIQSVLNVFETVKAIVTTSRIEEEKLKEQNENNNNYNNNYNGNGVGDSDSDTDDVDLNTFTNSLSILEETIMEQIQQDKSNKDQYEIAVPNDELLEKINLMIDLLPFFKNLNSFRHIYADFVNVLESEKKRYLSRFK